MNIQDRLTADLKEAMKAGEKARVDIIRNARAALQNARLELAKQKYDEAARKIEATIFDPLEREAAIGAIHADPNTPLNDAEAISVLQKEIKRRHDAAAIYRKGGREDLALSEEAEVALLEVYMPKMMSIDELRPAVAALIAELGLSGPSSMGKLMPILVERFKGKAEGRVLNQVARELLI
jgi:uncharacterized protein